MTEFHELRVTFRHSVESLFVGGEVDGVERCGGPLVAVHDLLRMGRCSEGVSDGSFEPRIDGGRLDV